MGKCAFLLLRLTTFMLALGGLVLSGYLLYLHTVDMRGGTLPHLCGGAFDCSTVLQSSYAMIGTQIPVASIGVLYFTLLAVWIFFVGRLPGYLHHACLWPALMTTVGATESVYLIHAMGWRLHAWCSFCVATHAINILLFGCLWAQWIGGCRARNEQEVLARGVRQLWKVPVLTVLTGCFLAIAILALGGAAVFANKHAMTAKELEKIQQDPDYERWQFLRTPSKADVLAVGRDDPSRGSADAPHTLVMFGDFQCQYCAMTDKALRDVQRSLGGSLRLVFKHYPYNQACNPGTPGSNRHVFACRAAEAAEAALKLGGNDAFWRMHDVLYENQDRLAEKPYDELAAQIGLDPVAFEKAMQDPSIRQRIERDAAIGKTLGIPGTPALFLDGRQVALDVVSKDVSGNEVDPEKTATYWKNLLAAADAAAATQPASVSSACATQPVASTAP